MHQRPLAVLPWLFALALAACGPTSTTPDVTLVDAVGLPDVVSTQDIVPVDVVPSDATPDTPSPAAACASTFGSAMPSGYFRTDGTVVAVLMPTDQQCAMPNGTHIIIELRVAGDVYRLVVNILSDSGDPDVRYAEVPHAMPAPAWSEGFHTGLGLDYATDLAVHANAPPFMRTPMATLLPTVVARLTVGAPLSVYASGSGGSSAHLVHRNGSNTDGAIVLSPQGDAPHFLLFHFSDQTF